MFWKRVGNGKLLVFLGTSFWQWDFNDIPGFPFRVGDLWPGWIRWMATQTNKQKLYVSLDKKEYEQGSDMIINAEVYDHAMRPLEDAEISFEVYKKSTKIALYRLLPVPDSPGLFSATIPLASTGKFNYTCRAEYQKNVIGVNKGRYAVTENPIEFKRLAADFRTLKKLAGVSGGSFYILNDFEKKISSEINFTPVSFMKENRFSTNSTWLLITWITILCTEWFLRKKWKVE